MDVEIQLLQVKEEFDAFLDWMEMRSPQRILEIGAHHGGTALHFCHMAKELVISVDLPDGESGGIPEDACKARNTMIRRVYPQFVGVLGDSHHDQTFYIVESLLRGHGDAMLDLLFIDGDHSYEGVRQDFEMYGPLVKPGGVIAFHDINDTETHRAAGCQVAKFWSELDVAKREFNVHGLWGGIGAVIV